MPKLTPQSCRAARAILELSARDLGARSGVAAETINKFENGRPLRGETAARIILTLEGAGVALLNGDEPGARQLRRATVEDDDAELRAWLAAQPGSLSAPSAADQILQVYWLRNTAQAIRDLEAREVAPEHEALKQDVLVRHRAFLESGLLD